MNIIFPSDLFFTDVHELFFFPVYRLAHVLLASVSPLDCKFYVDLPAHPTIFFFFFFEGLDEDQIVEINVTLRAIIRLFYGIFIFGSYHIFSTFPDAACCWHQAGTRDHSIGARVC